MPTWQACSAARTRRPSREDFTARWVQEYKRTSVRSTPWLRLYTDGLGDRVYAMSWMSFLVRLERTTESGAKSTV